MRLAVVVATIVAVPGLALAQAPGDQQAVPVAAPAPAVVVVRPAPVPAYRWSVGLSMGGLGIAPKDATDDQTTNFAVGELQVRYRATRHIELQLAAGGGQQKLDDGTEGKLVVSTFVASARYRFQPERHWNWYLSAGIGGLAVAQKDATDQEVQDSTRPLVEFGVGVERRFRHFALNAELSAMGIGETKAETDAASTSRSSDAPVMSTKDELSGGRFTIGASYYF